MAVKVPVEVHPRTLRAFQRLHVLSPQSVLRILNPRCLGNKRLVVKLWYVSCMTGPNKLNAADCIESLSYSNDECMVLRATSQPFVRSIQQYQHEQTDVIVYVYKTHVISVRVGHWHNDKLHLLQ